MTNISLFASSKTISVISTYYLIFSKQDGSITRKISIPFDEVKSPVARDGENWENWAAPVPTAMYQIVPDHTNWVLMETSSNVVAISFSLPFNRPLP